MSIKFVCSCGKHLRARDDLAARRTACPRCGAPVGIPSLQPTHSGTALGPMSPAERLRHRPAALPLELSAPSASPAAEPAVVGRPGKAEEGRRKQGTERGHHSDSSFLLPSSALPAAGPGSSRPSPERLPSGLGGQTAWRSLRYQRWVETHWYQCLLLPRRAWRLVFGLALGLTVFTGAAALVVPGLLNDSRGEDSWLLGLRWLGLVLPLLILGYGSGFLDCVFASARAGEVGYVRWPGRDLSLALRSGVRWLICFLAGPVVPMGASLLYWIYGGDLAFWDWLILIELNLLALSFWLLLLLALSQRDRLRDLLPTRVVEMIGRVGHRLTGWAVLASMLGLAHAWLASVGLEKVHHEFALGWLLLFLSWASGLFFATFLFRWVGIWFYWDRVRGKHLAGEDASPAQLGC